MKLLCEEAAVQITRDRYKQMCEFMYENGDFGEYCTDLLKKHFSDNKKFGYHHQYVDLYEEEGASSAQSARILTLCFMMHMIDSGDVEV